FFLVKKTVPYIFFAMMNYYNNTAAAVPAAIPLTSYYYIPICQNCSNLENRLQEASIQWSRCQHIIESQRRELDSPPKYCEGCAAYEKQLAAERRQNKSVSQEIDKLKALSESLRSQLEMERKKNKEEGSAFEKRSKKLKAQHLHLEEIKK